MCKKIACILGYIAQANSAEQSKSTVKEREDHCSVHLDEVCEFPVINR